MATTYRKTILLGDPIYREYPFEGLDNYDAGAIKPGHLVEITSAGEVQLHATAAGQASPRFAVELPARMGQGIDTAYDQDGETVLTAYCRPGDHVYAFLENGANVAIGALLESGGAGALQAGTTAPICRALEAVNNTSGAQARIKVEVI